MRITESGAILRHLAAKFGLLGDTPSARATADMLIEVRHGVDR